MKYIFMAGAPGSKWSSVSKNIYHSPDIDQSDYSDERTYYHDAPGEMMLMHMGAYFDPGMEFNLPNDLKKCSKEDLEKIFDAPFDGTGVRIIKSHIFCNHLEFIRATWPDCPIVLVHRSDDACLGWWIKCGHFNITYPDYAEYYQDLTVMAQRIKEQNENLMLDWQLHNGKIVDSNRMLCDVLGIAPPGDEYQQRYSDNDIKVKVI